jgi:hypothetical protein
VSAESDCVLFFSQEDVVSIIGDTDGIFISVLFERIVFGTCEQLKFIVASYSVKVQILSFSG